MAREMKPRRRDRAEVLLDRRHRPGRERHRRRVAEPQLGLELGARAVAAVLADRRPRLLGGIVGFVAPDRSRQHASLAVLRQCRQHRGAGERACGGKQHAPPAGIGNMSSLHSQFSSWCLRVASMRRSPSTSAATVSSASGRCDVRGHVLPPVHAASSRAVGFRCNGMALPIAPKRRTRRSRFIGACDKYRTAALSREKNCTIDLGIDWRCAFAPRSADGPPRISSAARAGNVSNQHAVGERAHHRRF